MLIIFSTRRDGLVLAFKDYHRRRVFGANGRACSAFLFYDVLRRRLVSVLASTVILAGLKFIFSFFAILLAILFSYLKITGSKVGEMSVFPYFSRGGFRASPISSSRRTAVF
ncbi:MAG: hypothetical protein ACLRTQ_08140 [Candidatus Borkfalkia sp.]